MLRQLATGASTVQLVLIFRRPLAPLLRSRSVGSNMGAPLTYTAKLESIAASAVKAADKVGAALIVVVTHTGGWTAGFRCVLCCAVMRRAVLCCTALSCAVLITLWPAIGSGCGLPSTRKALHTLSLGH